MDKKSFKIILITGIIITMITACTTAAAWFFETNKTVDISSYDTFRAATYGKAYDIDGAYGAQCWDGVALLYKQLGLKLYTRINTNENPGQAKYCWLNANARAANTGIDFLQVPKEQIKRGDIVVFDAMSSDNGHIGFADEDWNNSGKILIYGQNQKNANKNTGSPFNAEASYGRFPTSKILGVFRYKGWINCDINEEHFPDAAFREYVGQYDTDNNGKVSWNERKGVTYFAGLSWNNITSLKGIEFFTELKDVDCSDNQLTALDLSQNTKLEWLQCQNNQLTSLDVSHNPNLTELYCGGNLLKKVDVSHNTKLTVLECGMRNPLTSLDVSHNPNLKSLSCTGLGLKSLDVTHNPVLTSLNCYENKLTALDVSYNPELEELNCGANKLKALYVNHNPKLTRLTCSENKLSWLNLNPTTKLVELNCACNQMTKLDISGNPDLKYLYCSGNQLKTLYLRYNPSLEYCFCEGNQMDELDVSYCPVLAKLVKNTKRLRDRVGNSAWDTWEELGNDNWLAVLRTDIEVTVKAGDYISKPEFSPSELIEFFIIRCYELILDRQPDPHGLETWCANLSSGQKAASEIIDSFVRSNEFKGKNLSNAESVEILYKAMLGRGSDPAGKASWVAKLDAGQPLAAVINGFCGSNEFKAICGSYGIRPGSVDVPEEVPTTPEEKIKAFVKRCYRIILGRGADETGLNNWFNYLKTKQKAASEIIDGFVNSPEFLGKDYSSEESVEILYKAMLGRGSDPKGKANWVAKLNAGQPLAVVINGFCGSQEFTGLCASYGIEPGRVSIPEVVGQAEAELSYMALNAEEPITKRSEDNPNRVEIINPSDTVDFQIGTAVQAVYINEEKAKEFVSRCYQYILGRCASENELAGWVAQMTNGTKTADQIARGFLFSGEFKGKSVGNEDLVKILYRVYLNRDADPAGLASWTAKLDSGMGLKALLDSLVKTSEYKNVINEMGK